MLPFEYFAFDFEMNRAFGGVRRGNIVRTEIQC